MCESIIDWEDEYWYNPKLNYENNKKTNTLWINKETN